MALQVGLQLIRPLLVSEISEICILQRIGKTGKRYKRQRNTGIPVSLCFALCVLQILLSFFFKLKVCGSARQQSAGIVFLSFFVCLFVLLEFACCHVCWFSAIPQSSGVYTCRCPLSEPKRH